MKLASISRLICRPSAVSCVVLGAALLTACVAPDRQATVPEDVPTDEYADTGLSQELSADRLQQILIAEFAFYRNDIATSIEVLEKLAFETRDARIAQTVSVRAIGHRYFDVAANTTDLWTVLSPDSAQAWYANAVAHTATQKLDQATKSFRKGLALSPDSEQEAISDIGRTLKGHLNAQEAYAVFKQIIDGLPYSVASQLELIRLAIEASVERQLVDDMIHEGLRQAPGSDEFSSLLFALNLERGETEAAVKFAKSHLARYPQSERLRQSYANYLANEGYYREAVEQYEKLPDSESLYLQGVLHEQANYLELSRKKFLEFYEREPDNQNVLINLAELALEQNHFDEAKTWINRISDRNYAFSRFLLTAKFIAGTREVDEGIELLKSYPVQNEQQDIRISLIIESIYREDGQLEQALAVLDTALEKFPANPTLLIARSYTASEANLIDQVELTIKEVLDQQPDNPLALNSLGYTLVDQTDRIEEGLRYIEKALQQRPNDPYILDSMGWAHYRLGNYDLAIDFLKLALSRRDDPVMSAHLGEVYWVTGREQKARQVWGRASKKSPNSKILQETVNRLTSE